MEHNKIMKYVIGIFIIEIMIIGIWFYATKPESSTAFGILEIVLVLFGINLILGLLLYFFKKRFSVLFFANSIICPLIFYASWIMWFTYWAE
jgi:ABC-type polysaccharide/polyol phosphate export permease